MSGKPIKDMTRGEMEVELFRTRCELEWARHDCATYKETVDLLRAELGIK